MGTLLYHLATKTKPQINHHLPLIIKYIVSKKLDNNLRVEKAIEYALGHLNDINLKEFELYCGVGVVVTPEQLQKVVKDLINDNKNELLEKRYKFNSGPLMQKVRAKLPWADGKAVKNEVDIQIAALLGPKTEIDTAPVQKNEKKTKAAVKVTEKQSKSGEKTNKTTDGEYTYLKLYPFVCFYRFLFK